MFVSFTVLRKYSIKGKNVFQSRLGLVVGNFVETGSAVSHEIMHAEC